jgi:hypothetical protein
MYATHAFRRFCPALAGLAVAAAALLYAGPAAAQPAPGPVIPPGAKVFERQRIIEDWRRWQAEHRPATETRRETRPYIPPGAPLDRTYTCYAPPEGYEVLYAGTPAAPRWVTVLGPDGTPRSYRLEGPVVVRRPAAYVYRPRK